MMAPGIATKPRTVTALTPKRFPARPREPSNSKQMECMMRLDLQVLKYAAAPSLAIFCSNALAESVRAETLELVCTFGGIQQHISIDLTRQRVLVSSADATGGPYSASISDKYVRWTILARDADSLEQR